MSPWWPGFYEGRFARDVRKRAGAVAVFAGVAAVLLALGCITFFARQPVGGRREAPGAPAEARATVQHPAHLSPEAQKLFADMMRPRPIDSPRLQKLARDIQARRAGQAERLGEPAIEEQP